MRRDERGLTNQEPIVSKHHRINPTEIQLITYIDRLSGGGITALQQCLDQSLTSLFDGVHLLPFYPPIDGEDAGFDPIDHTMVDQRLGDWSQINQLASRYTVMADMIVNHVSAQSDAFLDVVAHGENSAHHALFLTKQKVFGQHADAAAIQAIYRPRPTTCFTPIQIGQATPSPYSVDFWTTFTANQIDIDVESDAGRAYLQLILQRFADNNIRLIRLDAAGYAIKRAGSRCFMLPETFDFIATLREDAHQLGMQTLVEIHGHHQTQIAIAKQVDYVYDFALPPLVLHTLFRRDASALVHWLTIAPRNCINVLDTHDGIGIIDVAAGAEGPGLLSDGDIDALVEQIHRNSQGQSRQATGHAANNVDLYQVNCTFYAALAENDEAYLVARAIQLFSPGICQIYYAGLLAAPNAMALLARTGVGRDINRPYYTADLLQQAQQRPVVQALQALITLRRQLKAIGGEFSVRQTNGVLSMLWQRQPSQSSSASTPLESAELRITLSSLNADIYWQDSSGQGHCHLADLLAKRQTSEATA
jgi:sucrose phosphorylase